MGTRVSMAWKLVTSYIVSWALTYLGALEPTYYIGVIIQLLYIP